MFTTENLRLFNLTASESFLLRDLVDNHVNKKSFKSRWFSLTCDRPKHIWGADLEVLLEKGLVGLYNSKYEEDVDSSVSDLEINKNRLEEIEYHFRVMSYGIVYDDDICGAIFEIIRKSQLFSLDKES